MAGQLTIQLLGQVTMTIDGRPLERLPSRTAEALLIYLVCQKRPVSREWLAEFFWDERPPEQAAANLRAVLTMLRPKLGPYLLITRDTVAFNLESDYWLDTAELQSLLGSVSSNQYSVSSTQYSVIGNRYLVTATSSLSKQDYQQLRHALSYYRGDFLEGYHLSDSRGFDEWALLERERLRRLATQALRRLVQDDLANGRYSDGLAHVERLLALDPYDEDSCRQMMGLLWRNGQRHAALQQYLTCRQLLADELGVEPSPTTTALYERIYAAPFPPPCHLPSVTTPFIGREAEMADVTRRLLHPDCRLLSILGPGGIGKTRLAIEAARQIAAQRPGQFPDGIYFVPLAALPTAEFLTTTLAEALKFAFQGTEPSQRQLFEHLKEREMLLILDNFEHLVGEHGLNWVADLLAQTRTVKLLVTSRERLRLLEEELFDVPGLAYPPPGEIIGADEYDAVQLFCQQAERIQTRFTPTADDLTAIVCLCQLVDGMPLAIELAAAGVRYFSCQDILIQLQHSLDVNFSQIQNRPSRHQSLRAVFVHSWSSLTADEQSIARRFAVFQGPFDMAAAEAVTGANAPQVALLLDKSFLKSESGRLGIHPLVRQFLSEKLNCDSAELTAVRARHADYFAHRSTVEIGQGNMERFYHALRKVLLDYSDNIIAAALWTAEQHDFTNRRLVTLIERLIFYFHHSLRFEAAKVTFHRLIEALQTRPDGSYEEQRLMAILQSRIAYADFRLHAYDRAQNALEALMPQVYALENGALLSFCQHTLGLLAYRAGDYPTAFHYLEMAPEPVSDYPPHYRWFVYRSLGEVALTAGQLDRAQQAHETAFALALEQDSYDEAAPIYELGMGSLAHRRGQLAEAQTRLKRAVELAKVKGNRLEIAFSLERLGWVTADSGDLETAHQLLAEAEQVANEFRAANALKDSRTLAFIQLAQGWLAECSNDLTAARALYERSTNLFEQIGDRAIWPLALVYLGRCCVRLEEWETAETLLQRALAVFQSSGHPGGIALVLGGLGKLYQKCGLDEQAQRILQQAWETAVSAGEQYYATLILS